MAIRPTPVAVSARCCRLMRDRRGDCRVWRGACDSSSSPSPAGLTADVPAAGVDAPLAVVEEDTPLTAAEEDAPLSAAEDDAPPAIARARVDTLPASAVVDLPRDVHNQQHHVGWFYCILHRYGRRVPSRASHRAARMMCSGGQPVKAIHVHGHHLDGSHQQLVNGTIASDQPREHRKVSRFAFTICPSSSKGLQDLTLLGTESYHWNARLNIFHHVTWVLVAFDASQRVVTHVPALL